MRFTVHEQGGSRAIDVPIEMMVVAGWTTRDAAALQAEIAGLTARGMAAPGKTPLFYPVGADRLTQAPVIHVLGPDTAGAAQAVLVGTTEGMLVTVGSGHSDHALAVSSMAAAQQACPKPVAPDAWWFKDVAPHWDRIELAGDHVAKDGSRTPAQRGTLAELAPPIDLVADHFYGYKAMPPGFVMYLGAPAGTTGGAERLAVSLHDPVLGRSLGHEYRVYAMPVVR